MQKIIETITACDLIIVIDEDGNAFKYQDDHDNPQWIKIVEKKDKDHD